MEKARCSVEEICGDTVGTYAHVNIYKSVSFDEQIKDVFKRKGQSPYVWMTMSLMPPLLASLGLEGERITVSRSTITRHRKKGGHFSSAEQWIALANNLDNPIAFGNAQEGKLWTYYDFGNNGIVKAVIEIEVRGVKSRVNNVLTAFYRDKNLEHDIEIGIAQRINQPSVRQHQLLADLPASTGSK